MNVTPGRRPATGEIEQGARWRAEFPYYWDADELVSRRGLLRFAVYTSGALFSVTALLALLGLTRKQGSRHIKPIALASQVAEGQAFYFNYPEPDDQAVLLHLPGGRFVAYSQKCTHLSCAVYYQADRGELFCPCHNGAFSPLTGDPTAGPPERRLPRVALSLEGDQLFAIGQEP